MLRPQWNDVLLYERWIEIVEKVCAVVKSFYVSNESGWPRKLGCNTVSLLFSENCLFLKIYISNRSLMSHSTIPKEIRLKIGITDNLVRLSVGLEEINDLIGDIDQALKVSQQENSKL